MSIAAGVKWYLMVVLICVALMISDTEQVFMSLLAIFISSLEKYVQIHCPFLDRCFLLLSSISSLCILDISP